MKEKKSIKINLKTYVIIMFTILLVIGIVLGYIFNTGKNISNRTTVGKNNYNNTMENVDEDDIVEDNESAEVEGEETSENRGFLQKKNNSNLLSKFKQDKNETEEIKNEEIETEEIINEEIETQEPISEEYVEETEVEDTTREELKNYLESLGIDAEQEGLLDVLGITL